MPLPLHLFIHFALAVLSGLIIGYYFDNLWFCLVVAIFGGFLIDLDHVIEYFLVFGPHLNLRYFFSGYQFLISGQIRIFFHALEYLPIFVIFFWMFRRQPEWSLFFITLALSGSIHLVSDCFINHYPLQNYSLIYRQKVNFSAEKLLNSEQYLKYLKEKKELNLNN